MGEGGNMMPWRLIPPRVRWIPRRFLPPPVVVAPRMVPVPVMRPRWRRMWRRRFW